MQKKERNYNLDLYFKSLQYQANLDEITKFFKNLEIDVNSFEKYYNIELEELEKKVIFGFQIEDKSLKNIANELNLSYSYVRKVYLEGKEKMRIILSIHTKNKIN